VEEVFNGQSRMDAEAMTTQVIGAFSQRLPMLGWMQPGDVEAAKAKAAKVFQKIGYPHYIFNNTELQAYYSQIWEVASGGDNFFQNGVLVQLADADRNLGKLHKPVDKTEWSMTPATVNAYYSPNENSINFPAGILRPPFYQDNFPHAVNFGGIGMVIGHVLTHGFDDQGSQYDGEGNLHSWWSPQTADAFKERTGCMEHQYGNFSVGGQHINGKLTLGENIADNGGLTASFNAYQAWVQEEHNGKPEPGLPGLEELSPQHLFFLSYASVWCSNQRPEAAHVQLLTDPHSPHLYRVNGPLSNSKDFASTFQCPANSPMNPTKKCIIW